MEDLKPIRRQTTTTLLATLTDNGVKTDWRDFSVIRAYIYALDQQMVSGPCSVEVDSSDETVLRCVYDAGKPQYLGPQKLVIYCEYEGQKNTYDKLAFRYVASTDETLNDGTTIAADTTDVYITVEDVSTSILSGAIAAALKAADDARAAEAEMEAAESQRQEAETSRQERAAQDHERAGEDHDTAVDDHAVMEGYDTRLTDVEGEVYHSEEVPYTDSDIVRWSLSADNMFIYSGGNKGIFLPITPGKQYVIPGANRKSVAAVLKTMPDLSTTTSKPADYATGFEGRIDILGDSSFEYVFTAPEDGQYCYMQLHTSKGNVDMHLFETSSINDDVAELRTRLDAIGEPTGDRDVNLAASLGNTLRRRFSETDEDGYEIPQTEQEYNVWRKSRQMTEIKWTPLVAVPQDSGEFSAGEEVTGLPYSSTKEIDKYICEDVSLYTFMTAVNNPYSLLYTENISAANSRSAWGKTYHGVNCASYYGTVCTVLSGHCVGYPIQYDSAVYQWLADYPLLAIKKFDQSFEGCAIGDIMWKPGHCRVIVGIKRDSSGNTTRLQISESLGTRCRQRDDMERDTFNQLMVSEGCIIYKPLQLYRNLDYIPSPFVAVGDEILSPFQYNDDICCFAGDKATFREGDTIAVNYNLKNVGAWNAMELYKDDALLDTITIDSSVHVVDLTPRNLTFGKYKARLSNGVTYSEYTEWEILQANVVCTISDGLATISITSANGVPIALKVCEINGNVRAARVLTAKEQSELTFTTDIIALNKQQYAAPIKGVSGLRLKIYFQGDYGRVTNDPIAVVF